MCGRGWWVGTCCENDYLSMLWCADPVIHLTIVFLRAHYNFFQLKILQAGWLRDGTWPEGAVPPDWEDPPQMPTPPPPPKPPRVSRGDLPLAESEQRYKQDLARHTREQEAYDAAIAARQHAEQYAHAMGFGPGMGIPPGYSPSSGDLDDRSSYGWPYAYAAPTPPSEGGRIIDGMPYQGDREGGDVNMVTCSQSGEAGLPPGKTGDEAMEIEEANVDERRSGDGRHEGG